MFKVKMQYTEDTSEYMDRLPIRMRDTCKACFISLWRSRENWKDSLLIIISMSRDVCIKVCIIRYPLKEKLSSRVIKNVLYFKCWK